LLTSLWQQLYAFGHVVCNTHACLRHLLASHVGGRYERLEYGRFSWVHLCGICGYIKTVDPKSAILDADKIFVGGLLKNLCLFIITQTAPIALIQTFLARR
jgi:hypothetical protein